MWLIRWMFVSSDTLLLVDRMDVYGVFRYFCCLVDVMGWMFVVFQDLFVFWSWVRP